jgi:hypothetical protein
MPTFSRPSARSNPHTRPSQILTAGHLGHRRRQAHRPIQHGLLVLKLLGACAVLFSERLMRDPAVLTAPLIVSYYLLISGAIALTLAAANSCGGGGDVGTTAAGGSGAPGGPAAVSVSVADPSNGSEYSGWGSSTPGGSGQPIYHVTNLNDSGPGSLRDAISQGNRYIVFDVGGTWHPLSTLFVLAPSSFITIDGTTAPSPGVTITDYSLRLDGDIHDVIIKNIRIRNPHLDGEGDGITVKNGVYNLVLDHISSDSPLDGAIDITKAHDITVQNSILSNTSVAMLYANIVGASEGTKHGSIHHNLFINSQWRNPNMGWDPNAVAPDTVADVRNNLIWNWGNSGGGTIWQCGATGNNVGNYYYSGATDPTRKAKGIVKECPGGPTLPVFYTAGNVSGDDSSAHLNSMGTTSTPYSAPPVGTTDACAAAMQVRQSAGAFPRDSIDHSLIAGVTLPGC